MIFIFFLIFANLYNCFAQIEGIFCGRENCYSVLDVTRDDDRQTIMRAYRKMARLYHPDLQKTEEAKLIAQEKFRQIVNAYDTLKDDAQRKEYDYFLDNPEEMYYHYYQYAKRRLGLKVDLHIALIAIITVFSVAQYYAQWSSYNEALDYIMKQPKYRNEAKEIAKQKVPDSKLNTRNNSKQSKDQLRREEEAHIRQIISNDLKIKSYEVKRGCFRKPSVTRTLWCQLFIWPVHCVLYCLHWIRWITVYWILRRELSWADKKEQIRYNLGTSREVWNDLDEQEINYYMQRELWIKKNFEVYAEELKAEEHRQNLENNKFKRYQRLMKRGGPGQITFVEDADF